MQFFAKSSRTYSSIFILHQPTTRPKYSVSGYESDLATPQARRDHAAMKRKVLTKYRKQTTGSQAGRVETRSGLDLLTLLSTHRSTYDNDHKWRTRHHCEICSELFTIQSAHKIWHVLLIMIRTASNFGSTCSLHVEPMFTSLNSFKLYILALYQLLAVGH